MASTDEASTEPSALARELDRAEQLISEQRHAAAVVILREARRKHGPDPDLLASLARAYEGAGLRTSAVAAYREVLSGNKRHLTANLGLGRLLLAENDSQAALDFFEAAAKYHPDSAEALALSGEALIRLGRPEQAVWHYRRAMRSDADSGNARTQLGLLLLDLNRYEEAAAELSHVVRLIPQSARAQFGLGQALLNLRYYEDAVGPLEMAVKLDDHLVTAHVYLGDALRGLRRFPEARTAYHCYSESPGAGGYLYVWSLLQSSYAALTLNLLEEARQEADMAVRATEELRDRDDTRKNDWTDLLAKVLYLRAVSEQGLGLFGEALANARRSELRESSLGLDADFLSGTLLWQLGRYPEAWSLFASITPESIEHTDQSVANYRMVCNALRYTFRNKEADSLFENALEKFPRNQILWYDRLTFCLDMYDECTPAPNRQSTRTPTASTPGKADPWAEAGEECQKYWMRQAWNSFSTARALLREDLQKAKRRLATTTNGGSDGNGEPSSTSAAKEKAETLQLMGLLHMVFGQDEMAEEHLLASAAADPDSHGVKVNLGVLYLKRQAAVKAAQQFVQALAQDPDNALLKQHMARAKLRLQSYDDAELINRRLLRLTPDNLDALVGLAHVLIARADEAGPEGVDAALPAYDEAVTLLQRTRKLNQSMDDPAPSARIASNKLSPRQLAAVHYDLGYIRTRQFDAYLQESPILSKRVDRRLLDEAEKNFTKARELDPQLLVASRALERLRARRPSAVEGSVLDKAAIGYSVLIFILLAALQLFAVMGRAPWNNGTLYGSLTLGLLALLVAALYLPNVSKLHVPGVQLEKSLPERNPVTAGRVMLTREPVAERVETMALIAPVLPEVSDPVAHYKPPEPPPDAKTGANEVGAHPSRDESGRN